MTSQHGTQRPDLNNTKIRCYYNGVCRLGQFTLIAYHILFFLKISLSILNFYAVVLRGYFRSNSLSPFYKISALKTSAKFLGKRVFWSLLSIKLQIFSLKSRIFLNELCKSFKNTFFMG